MKFLKWTGIVVVLLIAIYMILALLGPKDYRVERSIKIAAPVDVVYDQTTKLANWGAWSPWAASDPEAVYTIENDNQAVGATSSWDGEISGKGIMTITEIVENEKMVYELQFIEPEYKAMTSIGGFTYTQEEDSILLTWHDGATIDFMSRPMMLFIDLEEIIGPMFEKGLENIKEVSESMKDAINITEETVESQEILYVSDSASINTNEIGAKMGAAYGEIMALMGVANIEMAAAPIAITTDYSIEDMSCEFNAAIPVMGLSDELVLDGRIKKGNTYEGKVLKTVHTGSYDNLKVTYDKIVAHIKTNGYEMNGDSWEEYVDNPEEVEESVRRTFIYFPIQ